jgi:hypothetical protein
MGKEVEVQSKGELEIVNNRKAKQETEEKQKELGLMITNLYERLEVLEENK